MKPKLPRASVTPALPSVPELTAVAETEPVASIVMLSSTSASETTEEPATRFVAVMVPVPEAESEPPFPITSALVFVPAEILAKGTARVLSSTSVPPIQFVQDRSPTVRPVFVPERPEATPAADIDQLSSVRERLLEVIVTVSAAAPIRILSALASLAVISPVKVAVPDTLRVPALTWPMVVIVSAPTSMEPNPAVIEPEFRAPVPVITVSTASFISTSAASRPSKRLSSVEDMSVPFESILFAPILIA